MNIPKARLLKCSDLHHEVSTAVLAGDKHLLLKKPMGITLGERTSMIDLARQRDRLLCVGHESRLSSMCGKVKTMIDDGYIGDPKYCLVELSRNPYRLGSGGWRYDINRVGNWILEEPIHYFRLGTLVFGVHRISPARLRDGELQTTRPSRAT